MSVFKMVILVSSLVVYSKGLYYGDMMLFISTQIAQDILKHIGG